MRVPLVLLQLAILWVMAVADHPRHATINNGVSFSIPSSNSGRALQSNGIFSSLRNAIREGILRCIGGGDDGGDDDDGDGDGDGDGGPTDTPPTSPSSPNPVPTKMPTTPSPVAPDTTASPTKRPTGNDTETKPPTDDATDGVSTTDVPSRSPIQLPITDSPTALPTSGSPTKMPTKSPSRKPTGNPSRDPTPLPSASPSKQPSPVPTGFPTKRPSTGEPTANPTASPSKQPSKSPSQQPTPGPTGRPTTTAPSPSPSRKPSPAPTTLRPTPSPTPKPSNSPTKTPSAVPTGKPTLKPSAPPTPLPSQKPSSSPTRCPTPSPSKRPTKSPTRVPTPLPTPRPTPLPTKAPTKDPTKAPTKTPTKSPTKAPTKAPTANPTPDPTPGPVPAPPVTSNFNIALDLRGIEDQSTFTNAVAKWKTVITGDLPDINNLNAASKYCGSFPTFVDDLAICGLYEPIDGEYGIVGSAGPRLIRTGSNLPIAGEMRFDIDDVNRDNVNMLGVILHEMGHVLGLGSLWEILSLSTGFSTPCYYKLNSATSRAFQQLTGCSEQYAIPLEQNMQAGSNCAHWSENCLGMELMTPQANSELPMSIITIAALEDLGYEVNYGGADPFDKTLINSNCRCNRRHLRSSNDTVAPWEETNFNATKFRSERRQLSEEGYQAAYDYGQELLSENAFNKQEVPADAGYYDISDQIIFVLYEEEGQLYNILVTNR